MPWMLLVAAACSSPEAATPIPEPPSLDASKVFVPPVILTTTIPLSLEGEPGAMTPRATLRIIDLDTTAPPVETTAARDGSFRIDLEVPVGNELRLQPILGDQRGEPVDFLRVENAIALGPRHECFQVKSGLELAFTGADVGAGGSAGADGDSREIEVENTCATEATVDSPGTRLGLTEFALGTPLPFVVPAGASATVRVDRASSAREEREDVLFLSVGIDGVSRRYPITLFAPAR